MRVRGTAVLAPEAAFAPTRFMAELARRGVRVEERIEEPGYEREATFEVSRAGSSIPFGDGMRARGLHHDTGSCRKW